MPPCGSNDRLLATPAASLPRFCKLPARPLLQHITLRRAWVCCSSWRSLACIWRIRFCVSMAPLTAAARASRSPASAAATSACSTQPLCVQRPSLWMASAHRCQHGLRRAGWQHGGFQADRSQESKQVACSSRLGSRAFPVYESAQLTRCRRSNTAHLLLQLLLLCRSRSLRLCCLAPGLLKGPQGGLLLGLFSCHGPEEATGSLPGSTIHQLCRQVPRSGSEMLLCLATDRQATCPQVAPCQCMGVSGIHHKTNGVAAGAPHRAHVSKTRSVLACTLLPPMQQHLGSAWTCMAKVCMATDEAQTLCTFSPLATQMKR